MHDDSLSDSPGISRTVSNADQSWLCLSHTGFYWDLFHWFASATNITNHSLFKMWKLSQIESYVYHMSFMVESTAYFLYSMNDSRPSSEEKDDSKTLRQRTKYSCKHGVMSDMSKKHCTWTHLLWFTLNQTGPSGSILSGSSFPGPQFKVIQPNDYLILLSGDARDGAKGLVDAEEGSIEPWIVPYLIIWPKHYEPFRLWHHT